MKQHLIFAALIVLLIISITVTSRDFRVQRIPNGNIFSCQNCHFSQFGGDERNAFGNAVNQLVTPGGQQNFWGPALAALDSDGDGFTNGEELQDPNGTWQPGQPLPGNPSLVTNPGDPNSKPNTTSIVESKIPNGYKLLNNYPNPFNPSTRIAFEIPQEENVTLKIYNINGELVRTLLNNNLSAGRYEQIWNGKDEAGNYVVSGVYIYRITAGQFDKSANMLLMK